MAASRIISRRPTPFPRAAWVTKRSSRHTPCRLLAEYLHEMTVFPKGKHDDQVDSTAQFLDWYKKPFPSQGHYEYMRQRAQELQQRDKPQPTKTVWAIGSMEWLAEQKEAG